MRSEEFFGLGGAIDEKCGFCSLVSCFAMCKEFLESSRYSYLVTRNSLSCADYLRLLGLNFVTLDI